MNCCTFASVINDKSTICAIATPAGSGAIAVIRISGEEAISITSEIFLPSSPHKKLQDVKSNTIHFGSIHYNKEIIDQVLISVFKSPHSYTGEDIIEISCHGSYYIQQKIIELIIGKGARLAKPGEFTLRAFLNNKIDLSQAESVADLIASESEAAHKMAIHQMRGLFSNKLKVLRNSLIHFVSLIELELDFSEEDIEFADKKQLQNLVLELKENIDSLVESFALGNVIKNGIPVAIIGKPNVGKSTLLNTLLQEDKAIVSEIPGTTRDAIEDVISIEGFHFRFIDTAGLHETSDIIENLGIQKTHEKIKNAYIILLLVNAEDSLAEIALNISELKAGIDSNQRLIVLINKIDKHTQEELNSKFDEIKFKDLNIKDTVLMISAKKHMHIDVLNKELIKSIQLPSTGNNDIVVTNIRHFEALKLSSEALLRVRDGLLNGLPNDLIAQDLLEVLHYLGEITGEITTDEILGNIFKNFCIGK